MPIRFSDILSGKDSLDLAAEASLGFDDNITGGSTITAFPAAAAFASSMAMDHYRYRNFEAKGSVGFGLEIYDAAGRLKWSEDPDHQ
jgi:hypothetical protein